MVFWTLCSDCSTPIRRTGNDRSWRCIRCQRQARLNRLRVLNERRKSEAALARAHMSGVRQAVGGGPLNAAILLRRLSAGGTQGGLIPSR
jgi:hypothetical protein